MTDSMHSNDHEVLRHAIGWAREGWRSAVVTVLSTFGGSPRPPGCMAVIREDGVVIGSVSGGCVEDDLVEQILAGGFWCGTPTAVRVRTFGADAEERDKYRLPCNNSLRVAIEPDWNLALMEEALVRIGKRESIVRTVRYDTGAASLEVAGKRAFFSEDATGFSVMLGPRYRALVIGASELGRYLARILVTLDFAVTVCDPRPEYDDDWSMPGVERSRKMPTDLVLEMNCDERTAILAVTHDLKLDDLALMEALCTPAFYIGALGSQAATLKRKTRLKSFNLTNAQVDRLHGPIGLRIGSRTPAEIAVSIAAGLIEARRRLEQGAPCTRAHAEALC